MMKAAGIIAGLFLICATNASAQTGNLFADEIAQDAGSPLGALKSSFGRTPGRFSFIGPNTFCERDGNGNVTENCVFEHDLKSKAVDGPKVSVDAVTYKSAFDGPGHLNSNMNYVNKVLIGPSTSAGSLYITTSSLTDPAFSAGTVGAANIGGLGFGNVLGAEDNFMQQIEESPGGRAIDGPAFRGCVASATQSGISGAIAAERCAGGNILPVNNIPGGGDIESVYKLSNHPAHQWQQSADVLTARSLVRPSGAIASMGLDDLNSIRELKLSETIFGPHYQLAVDLSAIVGINRVERARTAFIDIVTDRYYRSLDSDNNVGATLASMNNSTTKRLAYRDVRTKADDYWYFVFFKNAYSDLNRALGKYCQLEKQGGVPQAHEFRPSYSTCEQGNIERCPEFASLQNSVAVNGFPVSEELLGALFRAERDVDDENDAAICDRLFNPDDASSKGNFTNLFQRVFGLRDTDLTDRRDISDREKAIFAISFNVAIAKVHEVLMDARAEVLSRTGNRTDDYFKQEALGKIDTYVDQLSTSFAQVQAALSEIILDVLERDKRRSMESSDNFAGKDPNSQGKGGAGSFGQNS